MSRRALFAIACATALSRWLVRARIPDDYDSFSFLLGMRDDWNLALFQPQFPGYPVYVAIGRALIRLGVPPVAAPTLIAAIASGVTAVALARIAEHIGGARAGTVTAALYFACWLPLLLGGGMLSEPLAAALATGALAALISKRPIVAGVLAGLLLGARASYWPLVLSFLVFERRRQFVGLALGILAWAPAFVAKFGAAHLWKLGVVHLHGHFETWGNTIVTRPSLGLRVARFARDLFYDGMAPNGWALAAVAILTLAVLVRNRPAFGDCRAWLVVLLPYGLWAFFGQNILLQPRHVLPLLLGLLVFLGVALAKQPIAAAAAVATLALVSLPLARIRHVIAPAPAQAASWAAERWRAESDRTAIFAIRSARFFVEQARAFEHPWTVNNRNWLTEIYVDLARLDRFPRHILITDEIDFHSGQPASVPLPRMPGRLVSGPRFCRDERIDRAVPCLQVFELDWAPQ